MLAYIPYMDPMGHRQAELPQMALAARMDVTKFPLFLGESEELKIYIP